VTRWVRHLGAVATLAVIGLATIPRDFQDHAHWSKVAWVPFLTGPVKLHDMVLNVVLYLPLGYLLPIRSARVRLISALVIGAALSMLLEWLQVWSHSRFPSATDFALNIVGSVLGAWLANRRDMRPATDAPLDARA
jgi:hypothetical protein